MSDDTIASRLRSIKEKRGWTAQNMADKTGMSRRTLESYMRRKNPALPGVEALRLLGEKLGISLDWLVLGEAQSLIDDMLRSRLAAEMAAKTVLSTTLDNVDQGKKLPLVELLVDEIGSKTAENAQSFHSLGLTTEEIALLWKKSSDQITTSVEQKTAEIKKRIEELEAAKVDGR